MEIAEQRPGVGVHLMQQAMALSVVWIADLRMQLTSALDWARPTRRGRRESLTPAAPSALCDQTLIGPSRLQEALLLAAAIESDHVLFETQALDTAAAASSVGVLVGEHGGERREVVHEYRG